MWLAVGYGLASLFPAPAPAAALLVAAFADPAASWIGGAGRVVAEKTWRGSAGHFVVAVAVLLVVGFSWTVSLVTATVGTTLERWPGPFNDNLTVPVVVAASVSLLV
jgi:dolichol kinase